MQEMNTNRLTLMKERANLDTSAGVRKLPIESELEGQICVHCGSRRYSLVFRMVKGQPGGRLSARCTQCRGYRAFIPDHIVPEATEVVGGYAGGPSV
ncbi:hypothetical protein W02_33230 [Nitrospira sp. KM1]|uniref:hypothetical protein n=1 Tax=Nitrospira sp. KM1 TaxID=1936990 RepID=UPI0013A796D4|nr:hypothetical protein [Nitrospira sp. KM1]BCA56183.1 hypothetical protein W02_33230 [Nitrospira sp. KM1]